MLFNFFDVNPRRNGKPRCTKIIHLGEVHLFERQRVTRAMLDLTSPSSSSENSGYSLTFSAYPPAECRTLTAHPVWHVVWRHDVHHPQICFGFWAMFCPTTDNIVRVNSRDLIFSAQYDDESLVQKRRSYFSPESSRLTI